MKDADLVISSKYLFSFLSWRWPFGYIVFISQIILKSLILMICNNPSSTSSLMISSCRNPIPQFSNTSDLIRMILPHVIICLKALYERLCLAS